MLSFSHNIARRAENKGQGDTVARVFVLFKCTINSDRGQEEGGNLHPPHQYSLKRLNGFRESKAGLIFLQ